MHAELQHVVARAQRPSKQRFARVLSVREVDRFLHHVPSVRGGQEVRGERYPGRCGNRVVRPLSGQVDGFSFVKGRLDWNGFVEIWKKGVVHVLQIHELFGTFVEDVLQVPGVEQHELFNALKRTKPRVRVPHINVKLGGNAFAAQEKPREGRAPTLFQRLEIVPEVRPVLFNVFFQLGQVIQEVPRSEVRDESLVFCVYWC